MIASHVKGSGFRGCLDYLLDEDKGAEIIGGNMAGESARELASEFGIMRAMRPALGKAVHHVSLSPAPGDPKLTDDDWNNVADRYINKMGFGKSQYIMVRHHDTDHQHVHIVANRVDTDGKTVSAQNDYRRSAKAMQDIEKEFGLQPSALTPSQARRKKKRKSPSRGEFQMMAATEKPSNRLQLQELVAVAAKRNPTMSQFINRLHRVGVGVMPHIQSTGRVQGISFEINGTAFKGSSLGKGYSFNGLQKKLGVSYEEKRDFKALEEAVSGGKKKELARVEQIERGYIDRGRQIEGIEKQLSTTEKEREAESERADAERERADREAAEKAELAAQQQQTQKLLAAAGDPEALKKAQERIARLKKQRDAALKKTIELEGKPSVAEENALLRKALNAYKERDEQQGRERGPEKE